MRLKVLKKLTWLHAFATCALALAIVFGCGREMVIHATAISLSAAPTNVSHIAAGRMVSGFAGPTRPNFREVAEAAGINYRWTIQGTRPLNILQTIGNGCAFLDFDGDGCLDILLVGPKLALYRGDGAGHFTDVSHSAGLDRLRGHFLGCAVGDYDNDGHDDLYISGYQTGLLLHNEGGKSFRDVTKAMGLRSLAWGTSCGFADIDGDGYLDLYVANYVHFDPGTDLVLCREHGMLTGCGPNDYDAEKGVLLHNERGRSFRDVTRAWRVASAHGKTLGVAFADFDGSGHTGIALANDLQAGDLFQVTAPGRLANIGAQSGTSLDPIGEKHAGMGIDWADYDNDGRLDLFVSTFGNETKCLYHNDGSGLFSYRSEDTNLDRPTLPYVAWGCKFFDADNDGWLDLMVANGHVQDNVGRYEKASYRQPTLFLHNRGGARPIFEDDSKTAGLDRLPNIVGRGLAIGDYDNDGRMDALVVDSEGRPFLLHNESTVPPQSWIGLKLVGKDHANRDAYGALVTVETTEHKLLRQCQTAGSYLSSSDSRVHVGVGRASIKRITIRWPDGRSQTLTSVPAGRYTSVVEGDPAG